MGTPFKMKGSAFYGKGNQSPAPQIGGVPDEVPSARLEPTSDNPGGDMPYSPSDSPTKQRREPTSDNPGGDIPYSASDSPTKQHSYKNMQGYAPKSDYDSYAAQKNAYLGMNVPSSPAKKVKRHYDSYAAAKGANAPLKQGDWINKSMLVKPDIYTQQAKQKAPTKKVKRHYDSYSAAKAANAPLKKVKRHYDSYAAAKMANAPLKQAGGKHTGKPTTWRKIMHHL
jgi:hypothetical protein